MPFCSFSAVSARRRHRLSSAKKSPARRPQSAVSSLSFSRSLRRRSSFISSTRPQCSLFCPSRRSCRSSRGARCTAASVSSRSIDVIQRTARSLRRRRCLSLPAHHHRQREGTSRPPSRLVLPRAQFVAYPFRFAFAVKKSPPPRFIFVRQWSLSLKFLERGPSYQYFGSPFAVKKMPHLFVSSSPSRPSSSGRPTLYRNRRVRCVSIPVSLAPPPPLLPSALCAMHRRHLVACVAVINTAPRRRSDEVGGPHCRSRRRPSVPPP